MKLWIYFYLDFVFLDFVLSTTSTHLYTEVDGNLMENYRIFLSIDVIDSTGLLLYAIDNVLNQFTIERKILFHRKREITYNFNGRQYKQIEMNDNLSPIVKYRILIQINNGNLMLGNENTVILWNISRKIITDHFENYPIPETIFKSKKTHFWIGNINPHIGFKKVPPLKYQLVGCVNGFYIHSKNKKLQYWSSGGNEISKTCWHNYTEDQCNGTKCKKSEIKVYNLDCRLSVMNVKECCYKNLLPYDENMNSFQKLTSTSEFTTVKLIWKEKYSENYCLIEITLSNTTVLFYSNKYDEIYYCIKTKSTNCTSTMLAKSFLNSTNHLIITLGNDIINLQISNGTFYKAYNDVISGSVETIKVGYSQFSNDICTKYQGDMIFRYNFDQFKPVIKDPIKTNENLIDLKIPIWVILIFIGIIILQDLAFVVHCFCKRKKNIKQQSNNTYNLYEECEIQQRNLPNAPENTENEAAIYSMIEKYDT